MRPVEQTVGFRSGGLTFSIEGTPPWTCAVRRCYMPYPALRGQHGMCLFRWRNPRMAAWLAGDEAIGEARWSSTLFLDVETTGLALDVDTLVFLVGAGYLSKDTSGRYRFSVRQYFARNALEVGPMLDTLFRKFARPSLIVTFYGSRFELPLLKAHAEHRDLDWPWEGVPTLDLALCARKTWAASLKKWKLRILEREILGYYRKTNLTGAEIPERWFEYRDTRNPDVLEPVFWHNVEDLLSLPALLSVLLDSMANPSFLGVKEKLSMARHAVSMQDWPRAHVILKKVLREASDPEDRLVAYRLQLKIYRQTDNATGLEACRQQLQREFPHLSR